MIYWRKKMSKKISEKKVDIELNFEDGEKENIELDMEEYLTIEILANADGVTFQEKFIQLLEEAVNNINPEEYI